MTESVQTFLENCRDRTNLLLHNCLPVDGPNQRLIEAIRYATLGNGKRIRPCLVYGGGAVVTGGSGGGSSEATDKSACAVELIHTYSLIHDDLPAMDDDELRRGQPTCHIKYDEATAILAGDALQTLAFDQLGQIDKLASAQVVLLFRTLIHAIGAQGMVLGQAMDMAATDSLVDIAYLETMHQHKTADLIAASVVMGAISNGETSETVLCALQDYGVHIGLAFQVRDDLLDELSDTATLGKQVGADARLHKATYPSLLGLNRSKSLLDDALKQSLKALDIFGDEARHLRDIAHYIVNRGF